MLKGKKSIYILLPVNLLIWGFIGYKIYSVLNEDEGVLPQDLKVTKTKINKTDSIEYTLSLNYDDPFLKKEIETKQFHKEPRSVPKNDKSNSQNSKPQKPVDLTPPKEIKYLGLIQNKTSGISTAMLSINGRSYIVKKSETVEGVTIKSIENESICVKDGKKTLTIGKLQ